MTRFTDWERFDATSLAWFYRLLGSVLLLRVVGDLSNGLWRVHSGELYPWGHVPYFPLYGQAGLCLEWLLMSAGGMGLVFHSQLARGRPLRIRLEVVLGVALLGIVMGLTQRFSNHCLLVGCVLFFALLAPLDAGDRGKLSLRHPNMALIRYQLVIVYSFSALHKVLAGFLDGSTIHVLIGFPPDLSILLAWGVVIGEFAMPWLLWRYPQLGLAGVVALHGPMAVLMTGILPFSVLMLALAVLFTSFEDRTMIVKRNW